MIRAQTINSTSIAEVLYHTLDNPICWWEQIKVVLKVLTVFILKPMPSDPATSYWNLGNFSLALASFCEAQGPIDLEFCIWEEIE